MLVCTIDPTPRVELIKSYDAALVENLSQPKRERLEQLRKSEINALRRAGFEADGTPLTFRTR